MIRITRNSCLAALLVALLLAACGCGRAPYRQRKLDLDVPEARDIVDAVQTIRRQGVDELARSVDAFAAPDLPAERRMGLQALFATFAQADAVELVGLDTFGERVYRASFFVSTSGAGGEMQEMHVLLVKIDDRLYWAGMN